MDLVLDKSDCRVELAGLTVAVAPHAYPPFHCQAVVEEQDTHLTLGEQRVLTDPGQPTWYLAHRLERDTGHPVGAVVGKGSHPRRLLAVVHDLDQEPSCTPQAIRQAYLAILQQTEENPFCSLALPLLGTVHGKLSQTESLGLLRAAIHQVNTPHLQRLWLMIEASSISQCVKLLAETQPHAAAAKP